MNSLPFYIGLGLGLALAAGLRPFLPLLLAGALASNKALGLTFAHGGFSFLESDWWLLAVAAALVLSYALQMLLAMEPTLDPAERPVRPSPLAAALAGIEMGAGAVLFAGALAAHGDSPWPGILAGFLVVGLAQRVSGPVVARVRKRLPDRGAREAVTLYLDAGALLVAALTALLHPLGYLVLALMLWAALAARRRAGEKYAGLRILRR